MIRDIQNPDKLPLTTNKKMQLAEDILYDLGTVAFFTSPELCGLQALKQVQLYLRYGSARKQVFSIGYIAVILIAAFNDINKGYRFGKLMLKVVEKHHINEYAHRTKNTYNLFIRHWKEHLKATLPDYKSGFQNSLDTGDIEYCAMNLLMYDLNKFLLGNDLNELEKDIQKHHQIILNFNQKHIHDLICIVWQGVLNLMDKNDNPTYLSGDVLNAEASLNSWIQSNSRTALDSFYYLNLRLCYLFYDLSRGAECLKKANEYMESLIATSLYRDFNYYVISAKTSFTQKCQDIVYLKAHLCQDIDYPNSTKFYIMPPKKQ